MSRAPFVLLALALLSSAAHAKVYYAKDEALHLAFPDAERIETRDVGIRIQPNTEIADYRGDEVGPERGHETAPADGRKTWIGQRGH